jgi:TPR repeat protein
LANIYSVGGFFGVPKDEHEAMVWTRHAAESGDARSQTKLAIAYADGKFIPKDDAQAVYWYRKAADQGDGGAQIILGERYARGEGVPKDKSQALAWFEKAAEQGGIARTMAMNHIKDLESLDKPQQVAAPSRP